MSFRSSIWTFILTLLGIDSIPVWLFFLHSESDHWTVWAVLGFGLVQICAGCVALIGLDRHYRGRRWEIGKKKVGIGAAALMGTLYFLNVIRYVEMAASSGSGWHWYDFLGICWRMILSITMLYVAYVLLKKWQGKASPYISLARSTARITAEALLIAS